MTEPDRTCKDPKTVNGIHEVSGSIPLGSTNLINRLNSFSLLLEC